MYETFEHTADLGLRVRAPNLDTLFIEAAACMFSAIVEDLTTVRHSKKIDIQLQGHDRELLLFDWLRELLFHFDAEHLLFGRFDVHVTDSSLNACAWGEPLDRTRHNLEHEVKAITYHGLRVERIGAEWVAEVIVDI